MIGHTKCYVQVLLPLDESLFGCSCDALLLSAGRFHVMGQVVDESKHTSTPVPIMVLTSLVCSLVLLTFVIRECQRGSLSVVVRMIMEVRSKSFKLLLPKAARVHLIEPMSSKFRPRHSQSTLLSKPNQAIQTTPMLPLQWYVLQFGWASCTNC